MIVISGKPLGNTVSIELVAYCSVCGEDIGNTIKNGRIEGRSDAIVYIPPCQICLEAEFNKGFNESNI